MYADENILYFNEDSCNAVFSCNQMGILNEDLNNIDLGNKFDEDDPNTNIFIKLLVCILNVKNAKHLKKIIEELISIASKRWRNFCISQDEKNEIQLVFTE